VIRRGVVESTSVGGSTCGGFVPPATPVPSSTSGAIPGFRGKAGATSGPKIKHSGLQIEVLSLYKGFLKVVRTKARDEEEKQKALAFVREKFKQRATWPKRDINTIEAWIRRAKKQLEMLKLEGTEGITFPSASAWGTLPNPDYDPVNDDSLRGRVEPADVRRGLKRTGCAGSSS